MRKKSIKLLAATENSDTSYTDSSESTTNRVKLSDIDVGVPELLLPVEGVDFEYTVGLHEQIEAWNPIKILKGRYSGIIFQVRAVKLEALARGKLSFDCRILRESDSSQEIVDVAEFRSIVSDIVTSVITDWVEQVEHQKGMNEHTADDSQVVNLR